MRHFRHLSTEQRRSIIVGYLGHEPKIAIARRLKIDNSTVHYHIKKIRQLPDTEIYRLLQPPCEVLCESKGHPSMKCLVCGTAHDNVKSEEFQEILRLRAVVIKLEERLSSYEKTDTSAYPRPNPVVSVRF